jgi:hypothetical protein
VVAFASSSSRQATAAINDFHLVDIVGGMITMTLHHDEEGCCGVTIAGDYENADGLLQYLLLYHQQPNLLLRSLTLWHVCFSWGRLSPLLERINCLIIVNCVISDCLPIEVVYEGLLYTPDYRRYLVIDDELDLAWWSDGTREVVGAFLIRLVAMY